MMKSIWRSLGILLVISLLGVGSAACGSDETGGSEVEQNDPRQNKNQPEQNPDEPENNQNSEEESVRAAEAHQWCAAAGRVDSKEISALNCAGPHDVSGFEATGEKTTWQPGAFRVVAE